MKRTVFALLLLFSSIVLVAGQSAVRVETGIVRGVVTRFGTTDPISDVQVALEGAVSPEQMQSLLTGAASAGINITPPPGATLSETTQLLTVTAAARGLPIQAQGIQNIVTRAVGTQTWPTTTTGSNGAFEFRDVKPGRYTVRAIRDGFFGRPVNGAYPPTAWTDIPLAANETTQVSISLTPGAIVGGRVYDVNGVLLPNTQVQLFSIAYQTGFALLQPAIPGPAKTTDDRGEFRLLWIPPGDYILGAQPAVRPGGPGTAFQPGPRTYYPNATRMAEAIPITIRGGEEVSGMDIAIRTGGLFKISGTVFNTIPLQVNPDGTRAPATVFFHLANRDLDLPADAQPANNSGNIQLALNDGPFEIPNVPPGSYEVLARVADPGVGQGLGGFSWGRAVVEVDDRGVRDVSITIAPAVTMKGVVRMSGGGTLAANVRVTLSPVGGGARVALYTLVSARAAAPVDKEGTFSVPSLPPGRFRVGAVTGLPQGFYIADVRQGAMSVFDSGFDIENRAPDPIEIIIAGGAGTVDGVVVDGPSKTVAGALVALIPEAKRFDNRALFANVTSDVNGRFAFRNVAPGDYRLFAWESTPPNAYQNAKFIRRYESRALTVHVGPGGASTAEVPLIPAVERN